MASASTRSRRRAPLPAHRSPSGLSIGDKAVTDWATIREWVLERDGSLCQLCLRREATDVDHIWPQRLGGDDHISNLRAACGPCNKAKSDRVDLEQATFLQLMAGMDVLDQRIEALEAERNTLHNQMLKNRLYDSGELSAGLLAEQSRLQLSRSAIDLRLSRIELARARLQAGKDPQ